jgi:hypothetical protein
MSRPTWPAGWPTIVKGRGALRAESGGWGEYCLVTTRSPWALVADEIGQAPRDVRLVESLERAHLEELAQAGDPTQLRNAMTRAREFVESLN